jgi:uncharacterized protein YndB with AHSA1/START domain
MIQDTPPAKLLFEVDLPEAPEQVWRALTLPAFVERWLLPLGAANKNGKADFAGKAPGLERPVEVTVLDAEPFRRLRWRWQEENEEAGLVTITLLPGTDGGTSLSLVHERRLTARLTRAPANANTAWALAA